jgi:integrase
VSDIRIAENIYRTATGFRVYYRARDPETGRSTKIGKRLPGTMTLPELEAYRDAAQLAADGDASDDLAGFAADARRYLALEDVQAMPAIKSRTREIEKWIEIFGETPRETIDKNTINNALHRLRKSGYSNSSTNKFRTALMALWTTLDGRSAANPVRDAVVFEEAPLVPRGHSYELLTRILDSIPDERGLTIDRATLYRDVWNEPATVVAKQYDVSSSFLKRLCRRFLIPTPPRGYWTMPPYARGPRPPLPRGVQGQSAELLKSRARLEILAWTGMDPLQLARMTAADFSFEGAGWYAPPARQKGKRVRRTPRLPVRLPMTPESRAAFQRLVAVDGLGAFNGASLLHVWLRACKRVERELRVELNNPRFVFPHIRIKDLRHSFGTKLYDDTGGDLNAVGRMLGHAPGSPMTLRYSLGAVPDVLQRAMEQFKPTARRKRDAAPVAAIRRVK